MLLIIIILLILFISAVVAGWVFFVFIIFAIIVLECWLIFKSYGKKSSEEGKPRKTRVALYISLVVEFIIFASGGNIFPNHFIRSFSDNSWLLFVGFLFICPIPIAVLIDTYVLTPIRDSKIKQEINETNKIG